MNETRGKPKRANAKRRLLLSCLSALMVIVFGPYLLSRVVANGRMVKICEHECEDLGSEYHGEISILIYNIAHGRGTALSNLSEGGAGKRHRISEIAELLREENADVVILNEVDFCCTWSGHQNQAEAIAIEASYPYHAEQRNLDLRFACGIWQFGNALLSRYPITSYELINYPSENALEPVFAGKKRGAVFSVELPDGMSIDILPVHLEHRKESVRVDSVRQILDAIDDRQFPIVLAGDFNSTPANTPGSRTTPDDGLNAMDTLNSSGLFLPLNVPEDEIEFTFPSTNPQKTIDWIVVPATCEIVEYRVIESTLSDHRPVFARIRIRNATSD